MSLTDKTKKIIKATVPIIKKNEAELAKRIYPLLFTRNPMIKIFFNREHLRNGTQPRAFIASIIEYANNIDNLDAIKPLVNDIAEKHASLNIKPVQYSVVNTCLVEAFGYVLGTKGTYAVKRAWEEAIEYFANIIIETETRKYEETLAKEGGWKGFKKFTLANKENESSLITSFYLEPTDGKTIVIGKAGQYINMMLEVPERGTVFRNYSLSNSPNSNYYRISVKREDNGLVSNYLHDTLSPGDKIKLSPPYGTLCLKETDKPAALISGGVGITPMLSILQDAVKQQLTRQISFIHGTRNKDAHAFKDDVVTLTADHDNINHHFFYSRNSVKSADTQPGRITMNSVKEIVSHQTDAEFYLCGPAQMMKDLYRALIQWGVDADNIAYEYFGPKGDITG
ncbi:ferredoxin-NADPH reductase [Candidatus Scalindua japonica]|uniref:nitric oxide dioxygenase n=1 Tax=Candidatus Scalindua japonica TaxID=1284222 RepID=A0A286U316_9BACT|nr:NO-inducible flavohemoprotein [Candidatus Scalindua japonica]GAX62522.1 ferredoxin-NADPH reductase [Candidatus Scalindua japonica]